MALEDRCAGVKDTFPNTENLQVNGADDSAVTSAIQAKLSQDKSINWVITLGAPQALDAIKAIAGRAARPRSAPSTLNTDAAQAVQDGKIQFCIDQQPYLQGYLAITQLYLFKKNGNVLGGGKAVADRPVVRRQAPTSPRSCRSSRRTPASPNLAGWPGQLRRPATARHKSSELHHESHLSRPHRGCTV